MTLFPQHRPRRNLSRSCWSSCTTLFALTVIVVGAIDALEDEVYDNPKYLRGTGTIIEDSYIVILKPGAALEELRNKASNFNGTLPKIERDSLLESFFNDTTTGRVDPEAELNTLVSEDEGDGVGVYDTVLLGFKLNLNDELTRTTKEAILRRLMDDAGVLFIEENQEVYAQVNDDCPDSWGLDRIDQLDAPMDGVYHYDFSGDGVDVYILDTGVRNTHQEFDNGRAVCGLSFVSGEGNSCDDPDGHGTHVAGTVAGKGTGVAREARIIAVKVLGSDGSGSTADIVDAIDWVARRASVETGRPSIINMSLGGQGASAAMNEAIFWARALYNVVTVVAAGNSNANACAYSPASSRSAITVGSTDRDDERSSFSNFGSCVNIFAPGRDIYSSWSTSDTDYNVISGTSMASPHIAGIAAVFWEANPDLSASQLAALVESEVSDDVVTSAQTADNNLGVTVSTFTTAVSDPVDNCVLPGPSVTSGRVTHGRPGVDSLFLLATQLAILTLGSVVSFRWI